MEGRLRVLVPFREHHPKCAHRGLQRLQAKLVRQQPVMTGVLPNIPALPGCLQCSARSLKAPSFEHCGVNGYVAWMQHSRRLQARRRGGVSLGGRTRG